jgi:16S rRNA (uracil1498-N3)-methyltransferase
MNVFYCREIIDEKATLDRSESQHCIRVLRLRKNDMISLIDGKGSIYEARIISENSSKCEVQVIKQVKDFNKRNFYLHVAIAPTKSADRFEWFIEKATETGIDEITPVICSRSERKTIKMERLWKIIVSSMKQALITTMPKLNELQNFPEFVTGSNINGCNKYIFHCAENNRQRIRDTYVPGSGVIGLIGPEGDFTPDEIEVAEKNNFQSASLGNNRLRTETAGVAVCQIFNFLNYQSTRFR